MTKRTITVQLERVRQAEYLSLDECALLIGVSKATIRRRLPQLPSPNDLIRNCRVVRIRKIAILRVFRPA